jgi:hypothetical protein
MPLSTDDREIVGKMFAYLKEREDECKEFVRHGDMQGAVDQLFLAETHTRSLLLMLLRSIDPKVAAEISAEHEL